MNLDHMIELTFSAILVYLVLANSDGFSKAITSTGNVYVQSVKALQGR